GGTCTRTGALTGHQGPVCYMCDNAKHDVTRWTICCTTSSTTKFCEESGTAPCGSLTWWWLGNWSNNNDCCLTCIKVSGNWTNLNEACDSRSNGVGPNGDNDNCDL